MPEPAGPPEASPDECALLDAAKRGDTAEVLRLIRAGVNVNALDHREVPWDVTPLMRACEGGHAQVVHILLETGADLNLRDKGIAGIEGGLGTALQYAVNYGHEAIAELLLSKGATFTGKIGGDTVLARAAYRGLRNVVKRLLELGANPNGRGRMKRTPLHSAVDSQQIDVVKALLCSGGEVHAQDELEVTPLILAVQKGSVEVCECLILAGADVDAADREGTSPLIWAVIEESLEMVELLLRSHANVNAVTNDGMTALDFAVRRNLAGIADMLRNAGSRTREDFQGGRLAYCSDEQGSSRRRDPVPQVTSEFQTAMKEIENVSGTSPIRSAEIPGVVFFKLPKKRVQTLVDQLQTSFLAKGIYVFDSNNHLGLMPTTDPYAVIAAIGTRADNCDLITDQIIAWLKELEREQPFVLTGIGRDFLSGRFTTPIRNTRKLARKLYAFCPDIVDQGTGTVASAARELKETGKLFLWWD